MLTIIIGTRTQSPLQAALDMAVADGRRFDVVAPQESVASVRAQVIGRSLTAKVWSAEPEQVKRGTIPLRIIARAHEVSRNVFLNSFRPDTHLMLACCLPSSGQAAWLGQLIKQEAEMEGLRVMRLGSSLSSHSLLMENFMLGYRAEREPA